MTDSPTHLRKLAEECVSASYRCNDVEAAAKLLEVATRLLELTGKAAPEKPELAV
jgi:hypothetical protein